MVAGTVVARQAPGEEKENRRKRPFFPEINQIVMYVMYVGRQTQTRVIRLSRWHTYKRATGEQGVAYLWSTELFPLSLSFTHSVTHLCTVFFLLRSIVPFPLCVYGCTNIFLHKIWSWLVKLAVQLDRMSSYTEKKLTKTLPTCIGTQYNSHLYQSFTKNVFVGTLPKAKFVS